jgi:hypothetical protein
MIVKHSFSKVKIGSKTTISFFRISTEVLVILNLCVHSQTSADTLLFGGVDNLFLSPAYTLVISVWKGNSSEICHPRKLKGNDSKTFFFKGEDWLKNDYLFFQNFNGSISNSKFVCTFANFGWHTSFRWSRQFVSESSIYTCDFGVEREFFRNLPSAEIKRKW